MFLLGLLMVFCQLLTFTTAKHYPHTRVFFIRHGEDAEDGSTGLSAIGKQRAMCVADIFGESSGFDIGYILVPKVKRSGHRRRAYETVAPLAESLGLKVDHHCARDNYKCVAKAIEKFDGLGNILIAWEHHGLKGIAKAMHYHHRVKYPGGHFEVIFEFPKHKHQKFKTANECCPKLDKCKNHTALVFEEVEEEDMSPADDLYLQEYL